MRISGPDARNVAEAILRFPPQSEAGSWKPWSAMLAELPDAAGHAVDQVVVTYFAAPRSYTAEDVIEISCHGAPVVLRFALERACASGARLAEPGEFTLRAYLNGRIDLPRAEAVRDLIDATTLYQARIAAQQIGGSVSLRLKPVKEQLLELIALLEAGIDFVGAGVRPLRACGGGAGSNRFECVCVEGCGGGKNRDRLAARAPFRRGLGQRPAVVDDAPLVAQQ